MRSRGPADGVIAGTFAKELHVSPFMGMDHVYEARATDPADTLSVHIASRRGGETAFDATLALQRRELTRSAVARLGVRFPFATARTLALIYGHAIGLKLAGARVHPHPANGAMRSREVGSVATARLGAAAPDPRRQPGDRRRPAPAHVRPRERRQRRSNFMMSASGGC